MLTRLIEEAARWKREVAAGNLSPESIERLKKEGVAKTPEEYVAGLRKGSENIVRNAGYDLNTNEMSFLKNPTDALVGFFSGGHYFNPMKGVRSPDRMGFLNKLKSRFSPDKIDPIERELILRHEANEAKYFSKGKYNFAKLGIDGKLIGNHNSMNVIADEARDVNFYNNLFGAAPNLKNHRNEKENVILQNKFGVGYNDINFDNLNKVKHQINKYEEKVIKPEMDARIERLQKAGARLQSEPGFINKIDNAVRVFKRYKQLQAEPFRGYNINTNK